MSDDIKHECGVALVRLRKPLEYYQEKYENVLWGFQKLFLLMEKQHNRGQDGAGIGAVKLNMPPGEAFMFRERDNGRNPITTVVRKAMKLYNEQLNKGTIFPEFPATVKQHWPFGAEVLLGHLRYGTSGGYTKSACQPYFRRSPWPTRNLMLAGNFNITNVDELNQRLIRRGAHPIFDTDTQTVLEEIGYHLDEAHTAVYHELRNAGTPSEQISPLLTKRLDIGRVLEEAAEYWDGGYTLAGMTGSGDAFIVRDPNGIRPAWYYQDDEVIACASERVALMTIFDRDAKDIHEVPPGHALVVKADASFALHKVTEPRTPRYCSFERIYFSRGNDPDIYQERKALGAALTTQIRKSIDNNLRNAVFSYIPNTAETAYYGLMAELDRTQRLLVRETLIEAQSKGTITTELIDDLLGGNWPRREKIAHKDIKLRTFISQESSRVQLASHVYDIAYDVVGPKDVLVCVDDSIVRGTTLKQSILRILSRTNPRKIVVASTAPQIRYPDCYGIDMSEMGKFIAFQAAVALLKDAGKSDLLQEVFMACVDDLKLPQEEQKNNVARIYDCFTDEEISARIAKLVFPSKEGWGGEVEIIYQTIENLHTALPKHTGDWYFTGNYPTSGGYAVLNRAFIRYYEGQKGRSY